MLARTDLWIALWLSIACCAMAAGDVVGQEPPVCNAGGPYEGSPMEAIVFDGTGSYDPDGTIVIYDWDFGDGHNGSGPTPQHEYTYEDMFVVTLCVVDNEGSESCCSTFAIIIAIPPNFPPVCYAGPGYHGNVGETVEFDGTGSWDPDGWIVSYEWDFGDGSTGEGPTPEHVYTIAGPYNVWLIVRDNDHDSSGCSTVAFINDLPVCDSGGPYSGAVGASVQFDGSSSYDPDGVIATYEWHFGDGSTGTGPTPQHVYTVSGLYTTTLIVTDDDDATSTCTTTVDISVVPVALTVFTAVARDHVVTLGWTTSHELDHQGFNVLRSDEGELLEPHPINDELIRSPGSTGEYLYVDRTVSAGETYAYYLEAVDLAGGTERFGPRVVTVPRSSPPPTILRPIYPNPFNPMAHLTIELAEPGYVSVTIYDSAGRPVTDLVNGHREAGVHQPTWDGCDSQGREMPSGVYFVQLEAGGRTMTRKMVMVR